MSNMRFLHARPFVPTVMEVSVTADFFVQFFLMKKE